MYNQCNHPMLLSMLQLQLMMTNLHIDVMDNPANKIVLV